MEQNDILAIIQAELDQAEPTHDFRTPLDYYLGNPMGNEVDGRSKVVSTDVCDAVEWIMPQVMKAFFAASKVVVFDPTGPDDEMQAELESEYVYDVLTKENNGFLLIHQFAKDALLHGFGVLKCYYEVDESVATEEYSGLMPEQAQATVQAPNVQVLEYGQLPDGTFALKIAVRTQGGRIVIDAVPPEQFRYNFAHDSVDLCDARFTAHVFSTTASDLIEQGIDPDLLADLTDDPGALPSDYRFAAQGEPAGTSMSASLDESLRRIEVAECYLRMDINQDGVAERVKVLAAGAGQPSIILSVEEVDDYPWISTTAILMPHKFRGLSIYDRLKQIQLQKTSLLRNTLDNIYLQNNQRTMVVEGQVNLDDALVSRAGGIIRVKRPDALVPLQTPPVAGDAFQMMQYLDEVRAGRVGVSPEGNATPQKIGSNVGSEGVDQLMTAKEELVGLVIRVLAETGVKPLCMKIRDLLTKHNDAVQSMKFRGQWVKTNPAQWPSRTRATIRVGTGAGDNRERLAAIQQIIQLQGTIQQIPGQILINPGKVYKALDDMCEWAELDGASKYFVDPGSPEGQQAAQSAQEQAQQQAQEQQAQQQAMMQAQMSIAQAEVKVAQAQQDKVQLQAQIDNLKHQLAQAQAAADAASADADRQLRKYEFDTKTALELTKLEMQSKQQEDANYLANLEAIDDEEPEMGGGDNEAENESETGEAPELNELEGAA